MTTSRPLSLALVALLLWSTGCTKWVSVEPPWGSALEQQEKLRITNALGVQTVLRGPELTADSVRGISVESYWERGDLKHRERRAAIPMDSVSKIERRGADLLTPLVVIAAIGLIAGAIGAVQMSEGIDLSGAFAD